MNDIGVAVTVRRAEQSSIFKVPSAVPGIKMAVPGINIKRKWLLLVFLLLLFIHSVMSDSFVPLWQ